VPRFVALKADEVNLRAGPGTRYPVQWVYKRRYMPVEITAEFEAWRHIRDHAGTTGWVHHSMLTGRRTVLVIGEMRTLYSEPDPASRPVARLEPGTLGAVERCSGTWCAVEFAGIDGWLRRSEVFGLYPDEEIR
jgi:SH3-like domain-containing protein